MKIPAATKPALWGALGGAIAMTVFGFSMLGWHGDRGAREMAAASARDAVTAAMVPFCVAKAQADDDPARLAKLRAETSSYSRSELVRSAGWSSLPGGQGGDFALATACSEKLLTTTAGR
jgi:hypothetical protein